MKQNFSIFFCTVFMSLLIAGFAVAEPFPPHNTHFQLEPASASSAPSTKVAAIYWLPDYLKDNLGTSSSTPDNGGGDIPAVTGKCASYDMFESCGSPKVSTGEVFVSENLKCQKGCVCPDSYQYTSANCNGDQELGGSVCDGKYNQCNNKPCPSNQSCPYGCKTYSSMSHCSSVCVECANDPCPGYYECGGAWQYCTGSKCAADTSKCSTYCKSDYFPNKCDNSSDCNGVYRNGYCSGSCTPADPCAGVSCGANAYCSSGSCYCNDGYSKSGGTCVKNCTPSANETGCTYGTESCSDGCGGTRTCCKAAPNCPTNLSCSYGCKTYSSVSGCTDRCTECKACTPSVDETGCTYGTYDCSDGCNGTRKCCNSAPNCPTAQSCAFGCKTFSTTAGCSDVCTECHSDNCHNRTAKTCTYGCQSNFSDCSSKCETCYSDNCRNRTAKTCTYGCQSNFSDCSSKCETCYSDNCRNRTAKTCTYGCQSNFSDCSSKCETCYTDNCRNRTAVAVPSHGSCSSYYSDCSSKCSAFTCNSGYKKSGDTCVEIKCAEGSTNYTLYDKEPTNTKCDTTTYLGKTCYFRCYYYYTGEYVDDDGRSSEPCSYYSFLKSWTYNGSYARYCYLSNGEKPQQGCWSQSGRYATQAECERERLTPHCMTYKCLTGQTDRSYPYEG